MIRVHLYKTHAAAVKAFHDVLDNKASIPMKASVSISQMCIDDGYIKCRFISNVEKIRGWQIDKAVFFYEPTEEELHKVKMQVKPDTTVLKPVTIEML